MKYDVLLTKKNNKYIARVCQWPEILVEDDTEEGALARAQLGLKNLLFGSRIVQLDTETHEHPWLTHAGMFSDDPDWEAFQDSVRQYREETDPQ